MNKVISNKYQESYIEETLDNGLKVVLWQKKGYEKNYFMMTTPLGALDIEQVDANGKNYQFEPGIAHFLEHKMFEDEDKDVMNLFSEMGANVNAFTSYTETAYHFTTTEDPEKPLNLLLDFVQRLTISDESVEKEKGIIIQELQMYQQMSDSRLINETFSSLFHEHPLRFDVGGSTDSVNRITKNRLEECYALNYHPSTMILVGVTGRELEPILEIIKNNQKKKTFKPIANVTRKQFEEPKEVKRPYYQFNMDVTTPKVNIAYKLQGIKEGMQRLKMEWCLKFILDASFTSLSDDYQQWLLDGTINDFYGFELEFGEDFGYMMFYTETEKLDEFKHIIESTLEKAKANCISEATLNQLKRRYYGQSIRDLNSFDDIAFTFMRDYFNKIDFFEALDVINTITLADIQTAAKLMDLNHQAVLHLMPIE